MSSAPDYSAGSKLLHRLALSSNFLPEASFDIERNVYGKHSEDCTDSKHVFVAGLARAGTTLLMRILHETGEFASLTYRDMPFVLAPNMWFKLSGSSSKSQDARERAHGDGVMVNYDSPEALEEVFWRVHAGNSYLAKDRLVPMTADQECIDQFQEYVSLILLKYGKARYLSKNNNSIVRLDTLSRAFPSASILVPFRDPVQHANSLMRQHEHFAGEQNSDPFIQQYMTWLGHHEFGLDHRPFRFGRQYSDLNPETGINYWLNIWVDVYGYLIKQCSDSNIQFFCYEKFCQSPESVTSRLLEICDISENNSELSVRSISKRKIEGVDSELEAEAHPIYSEMESRFSAQFNL